MARVTALTVGALVAALAAPGAAQIYKWTDDKGTVHFGNDPPPQTVVEQLPESEHRPLVQGGPPPPGADGSDALPSAAASARGPRAVESEPADAFEEALDGEREGEPDVIVVDDGRADLVTRYRANSPRNRPGQPIRQPVQRPARRAR